MNSSSIAWIVTIARSEGGFVAATARPVFPPHETPHMPVVPSHHGCAASQARASWPSVASWMANGGTGVPSDAP